MNEKVFVVMISSFVKLKGHNESTMEDVLVQDDPVEELVHMLF